METILLYLDAMKHAGKAGKAALKIILFTLIAVVIIDLAGYLATMRGPMFVALSTGLGVLWVLFTIFTLYFFRDPTPRVLAEKNLVLSPGHGTVDVIDTTDEPNIMGGGCQRISIFLSVLNVHVQNAPVSGKISYFKHNAGQFISALKTESASCNENVLIGIESGEPRGDKVGLRLIAGVLARRIVPWIALGDEVARGERISLIQFGSRVDVYLPHSAKIKIKLGDKTVGGETVLAVFE